MNKTTGEDDPSEPPYWNLLALGLPIAAIVICLVALNLPRSGPGDFVGVMGGIGPMVLSAIGLGVAGL
jgi:hypothetical protein